MPVAHWAYQSVQELAAAGVVSGYPDGRFHGQQTISRYEAAQALRLEHRWLQRTSQSAADEQRRDALDRVERAVADYAGTLVGRPGADGRAGRDGTPGRAGADGQPGAAGLDGRPGAAADTAAIEAEFAAFLKRFDAEFGGLTNELRTLRANLAAAEARLDLVEP